MADVTIPIQFAPGTLDQAILTGWQFSLFSVNLGESSDPEVEKAAIARIGSYGRQIGHIAEALAVIVEHLACSTTVSSPTSREMHSRCCSATWPARAV